MNTKFIVVIVIGVVAIVGLLFYSLFYTSLQVKPPISVGPYPKEIVPPPATGNVDDLVGALLNEITDEESVLKEEEGNTSLITNDSQEIGNFSNSVQETEL